MSSAQSLREVIRERLTAAAAEIFSEFEKTIVRYEEEIDRQRRLLEISWKPQINLHRIELPLHYVRTDEEVLTDQQLWNQERTSSLEQEQAEPLQEGPEPPQMKVEQDEPEPLQIVKQEELCISQDEEQCVLKQETVTSLVTPAGEERDHDEAEPDRHQLLLSLFPEAEIRAAAAPGSTVPTLDSSLGSCLPEACHTLNVAQRLWPSALHRSPVLDRSLLPATPLHQTVSSSDLACLPLLLKPPLRTVRLLHHYPVSEL
ncbi:uncharacterized protein [Nothobranchius furzeri]|uniref:uncharacterized protein isoform X2 n=1 Tax=Nothobranchius furzeri TaxID=105023 RepID=UPI003904D9D1